MKTLLATILIVGQMISSIAADTNYNAGECPDCGGEYEIISAIEWSCQYCGKENVDVEFYCPKCDYTITYTFDKVYD